MKKLTLLFLPLLSVMGAFTQSNKWDITGNSSGINDFIGTTNSQALVFKTDNQVRLKISPTGNVIVKDLESTTGGLVKVNDNGKLGRVDYPNNGAHFFDGNGNFTPLNNIVGWSMSGDLVTLGASKKVGIGVSNPTMQLEVLGDASITGALHVKDSLKVGDSSMVIVGNSIYTDNATMRINCSPYYAYNTVLNGLDATNTRVGIGALNPVGKVTIREGNNNHVSFGADYLNGNVGMMIKSHKNVTTTPINMSNASPANLSLVANEFNFYADGHIVPDMRIRTDGKIIIGSPTNITSAPAGYKLYVDDGILTEKVRVALCCGSDWSDFVFAPDYELLSLEEVESYIDDNCHLPGVPSAEQVVNEGIDVAKMDALLLQKIEELTLYVIQLDKENKALKREIDDLKK